jgi:hypothetical protein
MRKTINIGNHIFKTQSECEKYTRFVLTELDVSDSVKLKNEEYYNIFLVKTTRYFQTQIY